MVGFVSWKGGLSESLSAAFRAVVIAARKTERGASSRVRSLAEVVLEGIAGLAIDMNRVSDCADDWTYVLAGLEAGNEMSDFRRESVVAEHVVSELLALIYGKSL